MIICKYNLELEIFGLTLAVMEFVGIGKIIRNFFDWLTTKLEELIEWLRFGSSNFAKAFFLFYFIIGFTGWIYIKIKNISISDDELLKAGGGLVFSSILMFFLLRVIYFPLLSIILGIFNFVLKALNMKGFLAIIGLLIAITTFLVSQECQ